MNIELTKADFAAIESGDFDFINDKGAKFYAQQDYERAIEYYRLGASMGSTHSYSNLGYCYMYARSVPQNMSFALAYFKIAAKKQSVDALYKLGDIYKRGAGGVEQDNELALYYFQKAMAVIQNDYTVEARDYPSLYYAMAKELMPGGSLICDLKTAYRFLNIANEGFEIEIQSGIAYHADALEEVQKLLEEPCFDRVRIMENEYEN